MKRLTICFLYLIAFLAVALCIQAQEDKQRVQEKVLLEKAVVISDLNPAEMEKGNNNAITSSQGMLANNEQQKTEPNIQKETQDKILNKPEAIPVLEFIPK